MRADSTAGHGLRQVTDDTPDMTGVMSYAIAEQLFGDVSGAVGQQVLVNDVPVHVVGVAPPGFQGALRGMDDRALGAVERAGRYRGSHAAGSTTNRRCRSSRDWPPAHSGRRPPRSYGT